MLHLLNALLMQITYGTKKPANKTWSEKRCNNEEDIKRDFKGFNIALVAGDDFVLLDVEGIQKAGCANGILHLETIERNLGHLPMTPYYSTPSGGLGYIFKAPSFKVPHCDLSKEYGLELRTGHHYSIVPDSYYDGAADGKSYSGCYVWKITPDDVLQSEGEIPVCPQWLIDWFVAGLVKPERVGEAVSQSYERPEIRSVIADNIMKIDAECSREQWWKVMAVCHRAGALEEFCEWSKTAKTQYKGAKTDDEIKTQWHSMTKTAPAKAQNGEPLLGLTWFLEQVSAVQITSDEHVKIAPEIIPPFQESWPLLPLPGAAEELRLALKRSMPWQDEALYAVPLICAQAALQRKVIMWNKGLQSHWWTFIGGPASSKTAIKDTINRLIGDTNAGGVLESLPESQNGLRTALAENPSRVFLLDEGLKQINAMLTNESRSKSDAGLLSEILIRYNSKGDQPPSTHKKKEDRIPAVKAPQLMFVTFDQDTYWNSFRSSQATTNGLLSRFFMFRTNVVPVDYQQRQTEYVSSSELFRFSHDLKRMIREYGPVDPVNHVPNFYGSETWAHTSDGEDVFREFNNSFASWAHQQQDRVALLIRAVDAAKMLAQLCAGFDGKRRVEASHAHIACGIAARSLRNVGEEVPPFEMLVLQAAERALRLAKRPMSISELLNEIGQKVWRGKWALASSTIDRNFIKIKNKYQPLV